MVSYTVRRTVPFVRQKGVKIRPALTEGEDAVGELGVELVEGFLAGGVGGGPVGRRPGPVPGHLAAFLAELVGVGEGGRGGRVLAVVVQDLGLEEQVLEEQRQVGQR